MVRLRLRLLIHSHRFRGCHHSVKQYEFSRLDRYQKAGRAARHGSCRFERFHRADETKHDMFVVR